MGIPLPALAIRPPVAPEDPLSQFGRVVALRNMLLQHFQPPSRLHSFRPERFDEKSAV
jgi:hypothetical protein